MTARVFAGIDGGGTRARALVVDAAGAELARVLGPAGIVRAEDPAAAADAVGALARSALESAGAVPAEAVLCCALAGAGRTAEREAVRVALTVADVASQVLVVGDVEAMMADAFGDEPGVLVIAGTGSIAWARTLDGRQLRVGGWGLLLGDEGSGYDIGLAAMRAVTRAADGRAPQTALTPLVLAETGVRAASDLIGWSAKATKADIARLAPVVLQAAADADDVAVEIRARAVDELVLLATTTARLGGLERPRVALAGGLVENAGPLRDAVVSALSAQLPGSTILETTIDGARGAAFLARSTVTA